MSRTNKNKPSPKSIMKDKRTGLFKERLRMFARKKGGSGAGPDEIVLWCGGAAKYATAISWWGGNRFPRPPQLMILARGLDVSVDELLGDIRLNEFETRQIAALGGSSG